MKADVVRIRQTLYWTHGTYVKQPKGEPPYMFVPPKSKTSNREIDLSPSLKTELRQRYLVSQKTGLVFCQADGRPKHPNDFLKRPFARAVKAAGLGKLRFHDLRHSFGSLKLEQGSPIHYVQRQMGHSSISITIDIYGHLLETRKPEEAAKTDAFLFGNKAGAAQ